MTTQYLILITAPATNYQSHLSAIRLIESLSAEKQKVSAAFFYSEATSVANKLNTPPSDEPNIVEAWKNISKKYSVELQACVAASHRRGIVDSEESEANSLDCANMDGSFHAVGLGQLAAALNCAFDSNSEMPTNERNSDHYSTKLIHFK